GEGGPGGARLTTQPLPLELRAAIGAERLGRVLLSAWYLLRNAIHAGARDPHDLAHAMARGGRQDVAHTVDVHLEDLVLVEAPELRLHALGRGEVVDHVGAGDGVLEGGAIPEIERQGATHARHARRSAARARRARADAPPDSVPGGRHFP